MVLASVIPCYPLLWCYPVFMVLACDMVVTHVMVLARVMMLTCVMVLTRETQRGPRLLVIYKSPAQSSLPW